MHHVAVSVVCWFSATYSAEIYYLSHVISPICSFVQVSFPTSTNPSLGRRASRRLHRCHVDQKFWGLGFDRTRSSHLFFFIINIIANEEWLLDFVLLYFPITRKKLQKTPLMKKNPLYVIVERLTGDYYKCWQWICLIGLRLCYVLYWKKKLLKPFFI